jgi:hypothetical protein
VVVGRRRNRQNAAVLLALTRAESAARLGIAAAVALGAWLVLLGLFAVATRARTPRPGPQALELPGDEPPAVVAMLTDDWEVGREAVPATLIDLAARKIVAIEAVGPDRFVVRLRPTSATPADLTPYEDQVLDHVRGLAGADGTVPCEALTTGPEGESRNWWSRFEKAVVKDARDRGLSRSRWSKWMLVVLGAAALAPAALAAAAIVVVPPQDGAKEDNPIGGAVGLTALVWFPLMAIPAKLGAERDTPAGREAAAKWLGLREHLEGSGGFTDAPPAAVAIWDRFLSYGAALGVAAGAVRALPLGSESDEVAWTSHGGKWRMVKIDYPKRIPPGWGKPPLLATVIGLASLVGGLFVARVFFPLMGRTLSDMFDSLNNGFDPLNLLAVALVGIPTTIVAVWTVRAALMLRAAVPDLFARNEVEGLVLRIRRHEKQSYLAVDDGTRSVIKAWIVEPAVLDGAGLGQGSRVSATVTPHLGHVSRLENPATVDP